MSEVTPPADGGDQGAGGGDDGERAVTDWRTGLPAELGSDPALKAFENVEGLARSFIDTKKLVGLDKLVLPKDETDTAGWAAVWDRLGRPAEATAYEIAVPDGMPTEYADGFRGVAHEIGLTASQAKRLAIWNNEQTSAQMAALNQASQAEVQALQNEMGTEWQPKLEAAKKFAKAMGVDQDLADQLDAKLGSANLVKFFMTAAERMGEHGRLDTDGPAGGAISSDPVAERASLQADAGFREKLMAGDAGAKQRWDRLNAAIAAKKSA
ncbi:hypothetical protein [Sphingomonas sp. KC8]|uniref:hypothetical protein n=1 Tax=Sphingomonas sp. KC8 TaxID=1030157 RepID=UPI000248A431|nr:hypothetical protein [Sphingomonas sp. KC8]ARS27618.1 hypothetical protein KC8_09970 [Sphingomonas sp. KC8]